MKNIEEIVSKILNNNLLFTVVKENLSLYKRVKISLVIVVYQYKKKDKAKISLFDITMNIL